MATPDELEPLIALTPPAAEQAWDTAEYTCARCWTTVTASTEAEFVRLVVEHRDSCRGPQAGAR
ncbi:hypothetical protein [Kitasatospora cheerisanensis]|uniref:Uncharacterized protein n=1 Tax=Kitasatospora cheerisanensis KCTC 2395 TaxID=1348663 RepID=A0A066YTY5_9ACTN|nr:hypothetical protein [Kitasatospora cheerisanensis]KDN83454.1 hypothetical protein KCH_49360 [Kitasatospora cheerisanensis KCTC 2395]